MALQQRNDEMVNLLSADFQRRYESAFAWRTACSMYQALTGLRGFWPMSVVLASGNCADLSGNARTLTYNGNPQYNFGGLTPWLYFDGTGDYLSRADEGGLDILGTEAYIAAGHRGLTMGGWFYPADITTTDYLMSKWAAANFSYHLVIRGGDAGDPVRFTISDDGVNSDYADSTTGYAATTWQFMAGRFNDADTGEEIAVWLNDEKTTAATARASIFSGAADFNISGYNNGSALYTGRAALCFLCAAALDDAAIWALYQHTRALFGV